MWRSLSFWEEDGSFIWQMALAMTFTAARSRQRATQFIYILCFSFFFLSPLLLPFPPFSPFLLSFLDIYLEEYIQRRVGVKTEGRKEEEGEKKIYTLLTGYKSRDRERSCLLRECSCSLLFRFLSISSTSLIFPAPLSGFISSTTTTQSLYI